MTMKSIAAFVMKRNIVDKKTLAFFLQSKLHIDIAYIFLKHVACTSLQLLNCFFIKTAVWIIVSEC